MREPSSAALTETLASDPAIVTWWGTSVECVSAIARLEREAAFELDDVKRSIARLRAASESWAEVPATPPVRDQAIRLLRLHRLRAADAIHLGAAIVAADFDPSSLEFVTLDERQAVAAEREGFRVVS